MEGEGHITWPHAGVRQTEALRSRGVEDRHTAISSGLKYTLTLLLPLESVNLRTNCGNKVTSLISALHLSHLKAAPRWGRGANGTSGVLSDL